jgi:hypothetical protein
MSNNLVVSPAECGFTWELGEVAFQPENQGAKVSLGDAPFTKVVDVALFEKQFPGVILAALNGTSIKVFCQGVTRRMKLRDRAVSEAEMQKAVLDALRGVRSRGGSTVRFKYVVGGKSFDTIEAAQAHGREVLVSKGLDDETIEDILADLVREVAA